ncbi:MAG: YhdH/YhfP family quinone oxidoreductase [Desulfuromonadales bacterium]|nr:YhdH/YhfP family quinone oxidoreductase [Desulfuromonadales bacterium]
MPYTFKALLVDQPEQKRFTRNLVERTLSDLPEGELVVRVHWSSLNYKDALSATGHPGVTRHFPHTPGIDAAGEVVSDASGCFRPGEKVIVTGYDLGMETDGGYGQLIRIPAAWALPLPKGLSLRDAMVYGTAGLTAALSVHALTSHGIRPDAGEILVTGATGGVGSVAVALLAKLGYRVTAATGKPESAAFLTRLGASLVIAREEVTANVERPMLKERWHGVIDCVGGDTLAAAIKATRYGGVVTCCGLVGSAELSLNVYPFILRGVSLLGIDSVQCPLALRTAVWNRLGGEWHLSQLDELAEECSLEGLGEKIDAILQGRLQGRTVVKLD